MRNQPAGLSAMMAAFGQYRFDRARLRECRFPVFLGYGDLTGEHEEVRAAILARLLVEPGDLAHLIDDVVECLDLIAIESVYKAELQGAPPYHPRGYTLLAGMEAKLAALLDLDELIGN